MKRDLQFKKVLKTNAGKALDIVSNFDKYAEFVPGCTGGLINFKKILQLKLDDWSFQIFRKKNTLLNLEMRSLRISIIIKTIKRDLLTALMPNGPVNKIDKDFLRDKLFMLNLKLPFFVKMLLLPQTNSPNHFSNNVY